MNKNFGSPNKNVINVKESPYNAIGNGVADDTTTIQNAISSGNLPGLSAGSTDFYVIFDVMP